MFYLSNSYPNNYWGVTDTKDGVEEIYPFMQLKEFRENGIRIKGLFNTEVWDLKFLRPKVNIPNDLRKKAVSEIDDFLKKFRGYFELIDFIEENKDKSTDETATYYGKYIGLVLDLQSNHIDWFIKEVY